MTATRYQSGKVVHVKIKLKGPRKREPAFNKLCNALDSDWPYGEKNPEVCKKCGGLVYPRPVFDPRMISIAARQCGLKAVVKHFASEEVCNDAGV